MRLLKKRGRSICSLLVVFLMVLALMPAQAVSAEVVIDTAFSITGVFFNHEIEERFSGTVTVGETCPICNRGQLGWYWYGAEAKKYHGIECYFCGSSIEEECTSNATCTKEGTCTKCGISYKADHDDIYVFQQAATCTSIGYTQRCRYCRTCGDYFDAWGNILNKKDVEIPINKDAHSWSEEWSTSDEKHWYECTLCGEKKDEAVHSGGTATCIQLAKCSACEKEYGNYGPHKEITDPAVPATCTAPGKTEGKHCSVCNDVLVEQTEVPALTHDWGDWVTVTEPEVGKAGEQKRTCKREGCNESETREVPALISYTASISGDGNWTKGSTDSLIVTVNRSEDDENCISHYVETLIDGEAAAVTAEAGSTVVTVSPEILEKLGVGTHTVTVNFDDGNVEANLTVNEAEQKKDEPAAPAPTAEPTPAAPPATPDTGDENSLQPWSILLAGTAVCLVSVIISSKRSRVRKH